MDFSTKVISYINTNQLCAPKAKLIVGVSGGADSVALLHFLHQSGYQCLVAHCNFQLRGKDSEGDQEFVRQIANKWHLPFFSIRFDTKAFAKKHGISIEMAARDLRYEWFASLLQEQEAEAIAIAHHLDDSIETFFINLSRGTGVRGLLGIQPQQGNVIRPFLTVTRPEIDNYVKNNSLLFRIDRTNFDQLIIRNKIRHSLIPVLESVSPAFRQIMSDNFSRLNELNEVANDVIKLFASEAVANHKHYISIDIDKLKLQKNIHFFLYELLKPYNFNDSIVNNILYHLDGESGKQFFSSTHRLVKDRNHLLIAPITECDNQIYNIQEGTNVIESPVHLTFSDPLKADISSLVRKKEMAYIDLDKLSFPLHLRHPKEGDYFYPFGSKGKKKLSDFFTDEKWNLIEKEQCWLLLSKNQIVWVIGHRVDNRFKIDSNSKSMLIIGFS